MPCVKHVSQSLVKSWREVATPWVPHWPQKFTDAVSLGLASQDVRTVTFQYFAAFFVTEIGFTFLLIAPVCVEDLFPLNFNIYTHSRLATWGSSIYELQFRRMRIQITLSGDFHCWPGFCKADNGWTVPVTFEVKQVLG